MHLLNSIPLIINSQLAHFPSQTNVTIFGKIDHLRASAGIHFLPVPENYIPACTIQKHQGIDNKLPGLLLQTAFYRCCETTRVHFMVLRGINRAAWGTKLLLTPVLASFVDCISLCYIVKAQHCSLSLNGCFNPPSASL